MTSRVPLETIYEEIPHVRAQLREEADQLAIAICGPLDKARRSRGRDREQAQTVLVEIEHDDRERFREVYLQQGAALSGRSGNTGRRARRSPALGRNL